MRTSGCLVLPADVSDEPAMEAAHSASKAGCHGLMRVVANEPAHEGIRVNCASYVCGAFFVADGGYTAI